MKKQLLLSALMVSAASMSYSGGVPLNMVRMYLASYDKNEGSYSADTMINKLSELPDNSIVDVQGLPERRTMLLTVAAREKLCDELQNSTNESFTLKCAQLTAVPPTYQGKVEATLLGHADEYVNDSAQEV